MYFESVVFISDTIVTHVQLGVFGGLVPPSTMVPCTIGDRELPSMIAACLTALSAGPVV